MEYRVREVRKGILPTLVLALLKDEELSAIEIVERMESLGLRMPIGTVYPMLKRLEKSGLIESKRDVSGSKPRKKYRLTEQGEAMLEEMSEFLRHIFEVLRKLLWGSQG